MVDPWLIATSIVAFFMAFAIGSNDASNGLGTSYGSNALGLKWLLAIGAIMEFVGAAFCSDQVNETLSRSVIPDIDLVSEDL